MNEYLHGVVEPLSKVCVLVFNHFHCKQTQETGRLAKIYT